MHEPELLAAPEDQLLTDPGKVHAQEGQGEQRLGDEVPVSDCVHRVLEAGGEAQVRGDGIRVQRQGGACQRSGTQWRHVGPGPGVQQPVHVTRQRPTVCQEVVCQEHRLGLLQVGVAGQVRLGGTIGPRRQGSLEGRDHLRHLAQLAEGPEPEVGRHLVVPAPSRVQAGAGVAGQLGDPPLHRGVDVLVTDGEGERAVGHLDLDGVQCHEDRLGVDDRHEAHPSQHPDMGPRTGQVLPEHPPVEPEAVVEGLECLGGPSLEPSVPERRHVPTPPTLRPAEPASGASGRSA